MKVGGYFGQRNFNNKYILICSFLKTCLCLKPDTVLLPSVFPVCNGVSGTKEVLNKYLVNERKDE